MKILKIAFWIIGVLLPTIMFSIILYTNNTLHEFSQWILVYLLAFYETISWFSIK